MRSKTAFILCVLLGLAAYAQAQQPKAQLEPILLTDAEQKEIVDALKPVQSLSAELQQRWQDVLTAPLENAIQVVAKAQLTFSRLQTANLQAERVRDKHRLAHNCAACIYSDNLTSLVEPKATH